MALNSFGSRLVARGVFAAILSSRRRRGALAQDAEGLWTREDGAAGFSFRHAGRRLCGVIVWLKRARLQGSRGQQVFYDMTRADQNSWTGKAFNPEDGKTYSGKMVIERQEAEDKRLRLRRLDLQDRVLGALELTAPVFPRAPRRRFSMGFSRASY